MMYCDSAWFYVDKNSVTAYNNVRIVQGDSTTLRGNRLDYDGNRKYAIVKENVSLQDGQMTLTTDRIDYDMAKKTAFYVNTGKMTDGDNILYSKKGYYYQEAHNLFFKKDVELINPQYHMTCDTLQYNIRSKKAFFHGPTNIVSSGDRIYCESGWYNTGTNKAVFGKNTWLNSGSQYLYGDSLYYDRNKGYGQARTNIRVLDTVEHLLIEGQYAEHFETTKKTFITKQVLATKGFKEDSMYMTADTLRSEYDTSGVYRILRGYKHARIYNNSFQAAADSIVYSATDSTIDMHHSPIMWFGVYQSTADHIKIYTQNNEIVRADLDENAFMLNPEDSLRYSQVKGRNMTGLFRNSELYQVDVNGNGESIYFVRDDDSLYIGVNKIVSSNIRIGVANRKISRINFMQDPDANLLPIKTTSPNELKLSGFLWRGEERPKSKEELRGL
jgi:lipopolysaccharide export system protein LptA